MAVYDPYAIDASGGTPAYSAQEARILTVVPGMAGQGVALGARSGVRQSGTGLDLLVQAQASPNMTVKVNPGIAIIQGAISATQGAYTWALDSVSNVTIAASHATLDRTDLICIRVRDANVDTSGARDGGLVAITGTAGGGVPSLPTDATYFTLAQISVIHAVTSITSGAITDKRVFTAALGGTIPCLSTTHPGSLPAGARLYESDTGLNYTYNGSTWALDPYVWPFATTTARNAAIGSPTAGMYVDIAATNTLVRYDGSAWRQYMGVFGWAQRTTTSTSTTTEVGVLRIDSLNLMANRSYRISTSPLFLLSSVTGDVIIARLRVNTGGTATTASTQITSVQQKTDSAQPPAVNMLFVYQTSSAVTASVLLTVGRASGTGNASIFGSDTEIYIEDVGPSLTDTGVDI